MLNDILQALLFFILFPFRYFSVTTAFAIVFPIVYFVFQFLFVINLKPILKMFQYPPAAIVVLTGLGIVQILHIIYSTGLEKSGYIIGALYAIISASLTALILTKSNFASIIKFRYKILRGHICYIKGLIKVTENDLKLQAKNKIKSKGINAESLKQSIDTENIQITPSRKLLSLYNKRDLLEKTINKILESDIINQEFEKILKKALKSLSANASEIKNNEIETSPIKIDYIVYDNEEKAENYIEKALEEKGFKNICCMFDYEEIEHTDRDAVEREYKENRSEFGLTYLFASSEKKASIERALEENNSYYFNQAWKNHTKVVKTIYYITISVDI